MLKQASLAISLTLALSIYCCSGQQSCPDNNGGTLVGFTALTPQQLQAEIRSSIQDSIPEVTESLSKKLLEDTSHFLGELNQTIHDDLAETRELNKRLEESILDSIERAVERQVKTAVAEAIQALLANVTLQPLFTQAPPTQTPTPISQTTATRPTTATATTTPALPPVGLTSLNPATSCQEILESQPKTPSASYWVWSTSSDGTRSPVSVHCDMERSCGGLTGGWMRVVFLNMKDIHQTCPSNFRLQTHTQPSLRLCSTENTNSGCRGTFFPVNGVSYSHVCGRVIGYQDKTPNAFYNFDLNPSLTINDPYIDGISLTHGSQRDHIWSFVAALDETQGHLSACECSNTAVSQKADIPNFVGDDYFCDTGSRGSVAFELYGEDPLWDGRGCGTASTCCAFNNPPWFYKSLNSSSKDDLEMRVCRDSGVSNEDILIEIVELYVR